MALIRYPGSKAKLLDDIHQYCPDEVCTPLMSDAARWEYREPFFGSGAVGFHVLDTIHKKCPLWLNDFDPDLAALWRTVLLNPSAIVEQITGFTPTAELFYEFKRLDGNEVGSEAERGFRKLALHRMSVSGFGAMSGGPIGGRFQTNEKYNVGCRWPAEKMKYEIVLLHRRMRKFRDVRFTELDFERLIVGAPDECFIYLDPPYYEKGPQLYKYSMSDDDHRRLCGALKSVGCKWVLSYDDHPFVRDLYDWAEIRELHVSYSNAIARGAIRPKNKEVVIFPR